MITKINEAKISLKRISCDFKCKAIMNVIASVKSIRGEKKIIVAIPQHVFAGIAGI